MTNQAVRVGLAVFVVHPDGRILLGKRRGSHGSGSFQVPGGHIDFGESFDDCAKREVLEETGLRIHDAVFLTAMNSIFHKEGKHHVTVFMKGSCIDRAPAPKVMEPEKCEGWEWIAIDELCERSPLFLPLGNLVEAFGLEWLKNKAQAPGR